MAEGATPRVDTSGLVLDMLDVDVDLRLEVTTPAGETTAAHVSGSGQELRVDADNPEVLFSAVDRADVGRVADLLAATGITVEVFGPHGRAARVGAGTSSRLGRAVTGSARVAPDPAAAARLALTSRAARSIGLATPAAVVAYVVIRRILRPDPVPATLLQRVLAVFTRR